MTEGKEERPSAKSLSELMKNGPAAFDARLQSRMRGPAGAELRVAHLIEYIADKLFSGDMVKAKRLMELPDQLLNGLTLVEAASTHEGMVSAKEIISGLEAAGFHEGHLSFAEGVHHEARQETGLLVDLLPAAWGMSDGEFEQILKVSPGWLRAFRNHDVGMPPAIHRRLQLLRRFHSAMRLAYVPQRYAGAWRRRWSVDSIIGDRSLFEAFLQDGDAAIEKVELYWRSGG